MAKETSVLLARESKPKNATIEAMTAARRRRWRTYSPKSGADNWNRWQWSERSGNNWNSRWKD